MGDEKLQKEIGTRIKARRKHLKMTQELLAEKMDVSIQMISNLEQGKKAVRPENIVKLCLCLDISADYILRGIMTDADASAITESYKALSPEKQELVEKLVNMLLK